MIKSKEGMNVVLERLRMGGLGGVLEGMRRDREMIMGGGGISGRENAYNKVWPPQQSDVAVEQGFVDGAAPGKE